MPEKYYFMGYNYSFQDVKNLVCKICNISQKALSTENDLAYQIDKLVHGDTGVYAVFAKQMHDLRFSTFKP